MRASCRLSQKRLMRSSSSAFFIMSVNISEATCCAKRCGSRNRTERLSFLSLEWKCFRDSGPMIQATRSRRTHQTIYPTRASVHIELKVRSWTSPFTRKPWPSHRAGHEPCRSITVYQQRIQQRFDQRAKYLSDIRLAENITFVSAEPLVARNQGRSSFAIR